MKIHRAIQQRSWDWFKLRAGKVTGSELGNLITDKIKIRDWKTAMPNSYLHRKLAEKWRGEALQSFGGSQQTDQGVIYEEQARNFFASLLEADIEQVGGIESDSERLWCSPDGIIAVGETCGDCDPCVGGRPDQCAISPAKLVGLEIKCPNADTQVGWLLSGGVPEEHVLQVQFSLWVSGFKQWRFLSWCKDFPHLAVSVEPNAELFAVMESAVSDFNARLDAAFAKLVELNGGPPPKRKPFIPSPPENHDPDDYKV
jgi:hypothetical protein